MLQPSLNRVETRCLFIFSNLTDWELLKSTGHTKFICISVPKHRGTNDTFDQNSINGFLMPTSKAIVPEAEGVTCDGKVSVPVTSLERGRITPALLPYRMTEGKCVEGAVTGTALVKAAYCLGH